MPPPKNKFATKCNTISIIFNIRSGKSKQNGKDLRILAVVLFVILIVKLVVSNTRYPNAENLFHN